MRATVIIPTFGYAPYVRQAIASAQEQTIGGLEICVIMDGSPPEMENLLQGIAAHDSRIQLFWFPKSRRTGEPHRAVVIPKTTGRIICYLSHDDLWFPNHVACMERVLETADFCNSLHVGVGLGTEIGKILHSSVSDLSRPEHRDGILGDEHNNLRFGLTYGAHTRKAYNALPEGWVDTPDGVATDQYMWRKFISNPLLVTASFLGVTAVHFPRKRWIDNISADELEQELRIYLEKVKDSSFREEFLNSVIAYHMQVRKPIGRVVRGIVRKELREVIYEEFGIRHKCMNVLKRFARKFR